MRCGERPKSSKTQRLKKSKIEKRKTPKTQSLNIFKKEKTHPQLDKNQQFSMLKAGGASSPVHHCQPDQFFQSGEHIPRSQTACQSSPHWPPEIIYIFQRCSLEITSGMSRPRARTAVAIRMFVLPSEN